jgi:hypothetical protein
MGDHLFKWLLALAFGPAIVLVGLHMLAVILPVLIVLAVIGGIAAGLSAGLVLRRRLPRRNGGQALPPGLPPLGSYRRRRPRGGRDWR